MSASMYNRPYTYREPIPRVEYPELCYGCPCDFKLRNLFEAKFLALGTLLEALALLVTMITAILPFWFELILSPEDGTFGSEAVKNELTINTGLFFMYEKEMVNIAKLNKYTSSRAVVPRHLAIAQVFMVMGLCMLVACVTASVILAMRRLGSVTAFILLGFFSFVTGLIMVHAMIHVVVLVIASNCNFYDNDCDYSSNQPWRMIPIYTQFYRIEPHLTPFVKPNWAFYIACIGVLLAVGGGVLISLEAVIVYRAVTKIRYQQLRESRDQFEGDINPYDGRKFKYAPPVQTGPLSYGMQPVTHAHGFSGVVLAPTEPSYNPPPHVGYAPSAPYNPPRSARFSEPSPPSYRKSRGGESVSSSASGVNEVNI